METVWRPVQEVVNGVQNLQDAVASGERLVLELLERPASQRLNDNELVLLLALAASDSYTLSGSCRGKLEIIYKQYLNAAHDKHIQFGVYKVTTGIYKGKKILAYRGTDMSNVVSATRTIAQDLSLTFPLNMFGLPIREAIQRAVGFAEEHRADYICGHSLGGLLAECVCGKLGLPGASFNAPGPWSPYPWYNLLRPEHSGAKYDGAKFEVHLTRHDPISLFGSGLGPECSHVGKPVWHDGLGHKELLKNHGIELLIKNLESGQ